MGWGRMSTPLRQCSQRGRGRFALSGFCPQLACDLEQLYQVTRWDIVTEGCVGKVLLVLDLVDGGLAHTSTHSHAQPVWGSFASSPFSLSSSHFLGERKHLRGQDLE